MAKTARSLVLLASRIGVVYALVMLLFGASGAPHCPLLHVRLAGLAGVAAFYSAVATAYIYSLSPRLGLRLVVLLLMSQLLYSLEPLAPQEMLPLLHGLGSLAGLAAVSLIATRARGVARTTALMLASGYAAGAALAASTTPEVILYTLAMIHTTIMPAVYSVNIVSLYQTYRGRTPLPLAALPYAHAAAAAMGEWRLLAAPLLGYAVAVSAAAAAALRGSGGRTPSASAAHRYYLEGQLLAAAAAVLHAYMLVEGADPITLAHTAAMGFIAAHVYIHAPLMLPVIYGVRAGKNYTPAPYILLAASLAARLLEPRLAAPLFLASLAALAYVTLPRR